MNAIIDISNATLETERLILRPFNQNDLDDLYEYAKVDGVGQNAGWLPHKDKEESKEILNMFIEEKKIFAIVYKENNKVIGSIGIEDISDFGDLVNSPKLGRELGFVLSKDYWGQGLMPEGCKEVINYLFNTLNLDFITCGHFLRNSRSARVQEKLGFKPIGMIQHNTKYGTAEDTIVSILYK